MASWVISSVELSGQVETEKQRVRESTAGDLPEGRGGRIRKRQREHVRADALFNRERVLRLPRLEPADAWRDFANDVDGRSNPQARAEAYEAGVPGGTAPGQRVVRPEWRGVQRDDIADRPRDDETQCRNVVSLKIVLPFDADDARQPDWLRGRLVERVVLGRELKRLAVVGPRRNRLEVFHHTETV